MSDRKRIWTVPNVLTMFRLAMVPVYWVLMMGYRLNYWALGVFVLAACTDMLDGFLARKYNQITDFGKLMDPLADKLMTLSVMATLLLRGIIRWEPLVLLALKEFVMLLGGILLGVGAAYTALVVYVRSVIRQLRGVENTYNQRSE